MANINQIPMQQSMRESMTPVEWDHLNKAYGNTPTFLGAKPVGNSQELSGLDAVIAGVPWEGSNTWGSFSGCEQTPKAVRNASLRYGTGYIPEYDIEVMARLAVGDFGDFATYPKDMDKTIHSFDQEAASIFSHEAVPIFFGGDHSITYPILSALSAKYPRKVGLIHFDAHLDNMDDFAGDRFSRCSPLRRIAELPNIDPSKIVHVGIHGPRNSASQMRYVREMGLPIFTMADIRNQGLAEVVSKAQRIAGEGTEGYYVTVCSDIVDHAFNPGGPLDFGGLTSSEMCHTLYTLSQGKLLGMDIVEVYPRTDIHDASIHLVAWLAIYALAGIAVGRLAHDEKE